MTEEDQIIIRGTQHKLRILQEYQDKYSHSEKVIVTRKKGKILSDVTDDPIVYPTVPPTVRMRPRLSISYRVVELTSIYKVITTVIKEYVDSFTTRDLLPTGISPS